MLLLATLAFAAPSEQLWVDLPTEADRARARAAGFGFAEGQDGSWWLLDGTRDMADAAGLRWRAEALFPDGWAPTPALVRERLAALPAGEVVQIGESTLGAPLLAVRFGEGRAVRVLGGHHGDEGSSVEVALQLAEAVASGAVLLPGNLELWIVPVVNPDGLDAGTRHSAAGVDLNRNYGWEWSAAAYAAGEAPFSEPETRAIRALARARSFDAGLSLHSGAQNLGWVWNWTTEQRPVEESLLAERAQGYADACGAPEFWITNGADWYVTNGDTTDWAYGSWGAYDYTLELTTEKSPPIEEIPVYTAWHLGAVQAWLSEPATLEAVVVDDTTGDPIPARLYTTGAAPLWSGPDGRLTRWAERDAEWWVDAPGYAPAPLAPETRLTPTEILSVLPSPRLLSKGEGPTLVAVPGAGEGPLRLSQPGEADVLLEPASAGGWEVDPAALPPGAWTLTTDEGVIPRGLFIGEVDDRVALTGARVEGGLLVVDGLGFAPGAEAWSIGGSARAMRPLPRLSESTSQLVFSLAGSDDDALVWVNGAWLAVVDLSGTPHFDPSPPPVTPDTDPPIAVEPPEETERATCSTAAAPQSRGLLPLLSLGGLLWVRGRRRG